MKLFIFVILLMLSISKAPACENTVKEWSRTNFSKMHKVEGPYTIEQIIKENTYIPAGQKEPVIRTYFKKFKNLFQLGDVIYTVELNYGYSSTKSYILVRNKCIVARHSASHTLHNE